MEVHTELLTKHCRVCGKRLSKAKSRSTSYSCSEHQDTLQTCFGIDLSLDTASVHPLRFCNRCYMITRRMVANRERNMPYHHAVVPMKWTPHAHGDDCQVLALYI